MKTKTFNHFDLIGNGQLTLKVKDLPMTKMSLFTEMAKKDLRFTKGRLNASWKIGVDKGQWKTGPHTLSLSEPHIKIAKSFKRKTMFKIFGFNSQTLIEEKLQIKGRVTDFLIGNEKYDYKRLKLTEDN
jgi:hypothetical protein